MQILFQWLDFLWLPLGLVCVRKDQRLWVAGFIFMSMIMMRLQVELMDWTGFSHGFLGLLNWSAHMRGLAVYSFFYMLYLLWAIFSPFAKNTILMAGSISVFFMAATTAMVIMCL